MVQLATGANLLQLLGLDAAGEKIFHYQYPTFHCNTAFNRDSAPFGKHFLPNRCASAR